jgi:hypothetical protein
MFLLAAGAFWLFKRDEILSLHRVTIGGRFPMGCVVAEALAILVIAVVALVLYFTGAFGA